MLKFSIKLSNLFLQYAFKILILSTIFTKMQFIFNLIIVHVRKLPKLKEENQIFQIHFRKKKILNKIKLLNDYFFFYI